MTRDGRFVDPLRLDAPPAEPLPESERPAFEAALGEGLALLDRAATARRADAGQ
jgi:hypothetical protein